MLFKEQFYKILDHSVLNEAHTFKIKIDEAHAIFKGHFPGNPVTPGVVQMEIVKELVGESLGYKVKLITMSNCKFLAVLNPETDAEVNVSLIIQKNEEGQERVNAMILNDHNTYLKMSASYSAI